MTGQKNNKRSPVLILRVRVSGFDPIEGEFGSVEKALAYMRTNELEDGDYHIMRDYKTVTVCRPKQPANDLIIK